MRARARAARAVSRTRCAPTSWTAPGQPPVTDGSGRDRDTLRRALALLDAAGYELAARCCVDAATRQPFAFEMLVTTKDQERLALAFSRDLKRAGIALRVRVVDAVQYDRRRITYDFDMIEYRWDQSLSPGNEQAFYWGSAAADARRHPQLYGRQKRRRSTP